MSYQYGFTSGKMLEYIYENNPQGFLFVGHMIDRIYLKHNGWESIRIRMRNLVESICTVLSSLNNNIEIVDIAGGTGFYLFETLKKADKKNIHITVRDFDKRWVKEGNSNALKRKLSKHILFKYGDAFDENDMKTDIKKANIVIASGFYDWFEDDDTMIKSMHIIRKLINNNSYFIFTIQTGHFDVDFVNYVFLDFHRKRLNMSVRPDEGIVNILKKTGFSIMSKQPGPWGYYTVYVSKPV